MNDLTIGIADDHPVVIEGIRRVLETAPGVDKVISFTRGGDLLAYLESGFLDIVFLDIVLPDGNGIDFCKDIKSLSAETIVLALSNQAERSTIMQMLQNGASGYLLKNASAEELTDAVTNAMNGKIVLSDEVQQIMTRPGKNELGNMPSLTKREKEIMGMLSEGKTTSVIAEELNLSPLTIDTHRKNLLQKFGVNNTVELLMAAIQRKML